MPAAMRTTALKCWIAHLVGLLLCLMALQLRLNDGNFTAVDHVSEHLQIKEASRLLLSSHRRWSQSMKTISSKLVATSSPSSKVRPSSEPPSSSQGGADRPTSAEPPFPVGSPVLMAPAPTVIAPNSAPQPATATISPTSAGARTGSKSNTSVTPIASLPLPALPRPSSHLPSAPTTQLLSPAPAPSPAPSPIYGFPHMAQPPVPTIGTSSKPPSSIPSLRSPPNKVAPSTASMQPPPNGNTTSADAPFTSPSSGCCAPDMVPKPGLPSDSCICVYPIRLELLVEDVSTDFANWSSEFQQELASQLGLKVIQIEITSFKLNGPNLSLVIEIGPLTGSSFSLQQARTIRTELDQFKVHFNSSLFGNYTLLRFRYFEAPTPPLSGVQTPASENFPAPPPQKHLNEAVIDMKKERSLSLPFIIGIAAGAVIAAAVILIVLWRYLIPCRAGKQTYKCSVKGTSTRATSSPIDAVSLETRSIPRSATTRCFTFEELKHATNNFELASVLGEGGFGRVYKGVLKDGTAVAIKRLTGGGHQGDREFLVEVEMLSRLHHRNLVKLIGYYTSGDSMQHLLCYELIPNGSLESWLHGPLGANLPLDWDTRMKIALDAARGLAYLHEDSQPCVIHRDFKASNILIENDFHAKVADFGLAKQAPEGQTNYVSTRVMGTFGYVAPEYAMTGHLLVKSDVYSYGVVLLELLSGRKPVDMSQPSGQENLVTWARPLLRDTERLIDLVDPKLFGKYPRDDVAQVAAMAAACVSPEASQRPTMGEVVQSLKLVQRSSEYPTSGERNTSADTTIFTSVSNTSVPRGAQNARHASTAFESDGSSSAFSSGPFSCIIGLESDVLSRTVLFSEDLQEGR